MGWYRILRSCFETGTLESFIEYTTRTPKWFEKSKAFGSAKLTVLGVILLMSDKNLLQQFLTIAPPDILYRPCCILKDGREILPLVYIYGLDSGDCLAVVLNSTLCVNAVRPWRIGLTCNRAWNTFEREQRARALIWVMTREPSQIWRDLAPDIARVLLGCSVVYWKRPFFI